MSDTPVVMKYDTEKNRLELLPTSLLTEVGKVLTYGAKKYRDRGWEAGMDWSRVYGATLRHLTAFWDGEDLDPETGLPHLAHAACEVAFLLEYMTTHPELDNRPKRVPAKENHDYVVVDPAKVDRPMFFPTQSNPGSILKTDRWGNPI